MHQVPDILDGQGPSLFEGLIGNSFFADSKQMLVEREKKKKNTTKKELSQKCIQRICSAESNVRYLVSEPLTKLAPY